MAAAPRSLRHQKTHDKCPSRARQAITAGRSTDTLCPLIGQTTALPGPPPSPTPPGDFSFSSASSVYSSLRRISCDLIYLLIYLETKDRAVCFEVVYARQLVVTQDAGWLLPKG